MTVNKILQVLKLGDNKGSALKELSKYYGCEDYDLSPISDEMADKWLSRQKCKCWRKGHWYIKDMDTCLGTKEGEPCTCKGDMTMCDLLK